MNLSIVYVIMHQIYDGDVRFCFSYFGNQGEKERNLYRLSVVGSLETAHRRKYICSRPNSLYKYSLLQSRQV